MGRRVLVCGGRDYADRDAMWSFLDLGHRAGAIEVLIHGGARGADRLAGEWAKQRGVVVLVYPANWKIYGPSAGPLRNQRMLDLGRPDVVVAFPGGDGTADMVRRAVRAGVRVVEVK